MDEIERYINDLQLEKKSLLVACSGGMDSVVLVHLLKKFKLNLEIIHINYQLRGKDSFKDEQLVRDLAQQLELELTVVLCPTELTKGKGINLQQAARDFRFQQFKKWTEKSENHWVVLGHHADDQIETFFLKILRDSGLNGLGGMRELTNQILRPLLPFTKLQLKEYALKNSIHWREDKSNSTNHYLRNWIRNDFLPKTDKNQPELKEAVKTIMRVFLHEKLALLDKLKGTIAVIQNSNELDIKWFTELNPTEQHVFLQEMGWSACTKYMIENALHLEQSKTVIIEQSTWYKTKKNTLKKTGTALEATHKLHFTHIEISEMKFDNNVCYIPLNSDLSKIWLTTADQQMTMHPKGLKGKQKIWKILKEAGIPAQERASQPIIMFENEVLWVPGIKRSSLLLTEKEPIIYAISLI